MAGRAGVAPQVSATASQTSSAKSSSVALKVSGEYSNPQSVAPSAAAMSRICAVARVAISSDAGPILLEDHPPEHRRRGVVDVHHRPAGATQRRKRAVDQVLAGLNQHLHGDVGGDAVFLDEAAHEVELHLRGGGERDLDLLEPDPDQRLEHPQLAGLIHRLDQRLVAVAKVGAAPEGRSGDHLTRPPAVRQRDGRCWEVLVCGVLEHHHRREWR